MYKILTFLLIIFSTLGAHEWKNVHEHPMPLHTDVIFYDSIMDASYIGDPCDYFEYCSFFCGFTPEVMWWMPAPKSPKELGLLDAED